MLRKLILVQRKIKQWFDSLDAVYVEGLAHVAAFIIIVFLLILFALFTEIIFSIRDSFK